MALHPPGEQGWPLCGMWSPGRVKLSEEEGETMTTAERARQVRQAILDCLDDKANPGKPTILGRRVSRPWPGEPILCFDDDRTPVDTVALVQLGCGWRRG